MNSVRRPPLILDDEQAVRQIFFGFFQNGLWQTNQEESAEEAQTPIKVTRPTAATMDMDLPRVDGSAPARTPNRLDFTTVL